MGVLILVAAVVMAIFLVKRPKSPRKSAYFQGEQHISRTGKTKNTKHLDWGLMLLVFLLIAFGIFCFNFVF